MGKGDNSYRSILKGISAFAGAQMFVVLANLVRGKFAALFLGPEGMGIAAIFNNASNTVSRASSLGLNLAIVREAADVGDNPGKLRTLMGVSAAMTRLTALAGALACVLLAVPLSRLSFGSDGYAWQFVMLGAAVYLTISGNARLSVLQGLHLVKRVAKASVVGALAGLLVGVPLYWLYGDKGIVPAIVALQLSLWGFYTFNLRRAAGKVAPDFSFKENKGLVKRLLGLGLVLLSGDLIGAMCEYGVNLFLRMEADLDTVGLYQAANSITKQYAGIVFTAMSLDYFPRLAAAFADKREVKGIVSRQMEVVALGMAPLACLAVAFAPLVIRLLLTDKFAGIETLLRLMSVGLVFKGLQFPLGYLSFAGDNKRLFFWLEAVTANVLYVGGLAGGYLLGGLNGIGWAFIAENALAIAIYTLVNRRYYGVVPNAAAWRAGGISVALAAACWAGSVWQCAAGTALMWGAAAVAVLYCGFELKRMLFGKP